MNDQDFVSARWTEPEGAKTPRFRNVVIGFRQLVDQNVTRYNEIQVKRDTLLGVIACLLEKR